MAAPSAHSGVIPTGTHLAPLTGLIAVGVWTTVIVAAAVRLTRRAA
jgi:hypothetical protein